MSIKVSLYYWDQAQIESHTDKLVLLALSDWCNDEGWCYPSVPNIARRCSLTDRGVQKVLSRLVAAGLLRIEKDAGIHTGQGSATSRFHLISYQAANGQTAAMVGMHPKDEQGSPIKGKRDPRRVNAVTRRVNAVPSKGEHGSPDPLVDPLVEPIPPARATPVPEPAEIERTPAVTVKAGPPSVAVVPTDSPHLPRGLRLPGGYIPAGTGVNPIQVYYERFRFTDPDSHLNRPQEDDLARLCPDLARLREVVTAYSRTAYRRGNVQLIIDWYRDGVPQQGHAASRQSNRPGQSSNNRNGAGSGYSRQDRGGKAPRKAKTPDDFADDPEMQQFLAGFIDARDAIAAD